MEAKILVLILLFSVVNATSPEKGKSAPEASTKSAGGAGGVFDIVAKYGAKADEKTDAAKAISDAFKDACAASGKSKILIPKGTYACGPVKMTGPCKGQIEMEVQGTLKAPADPAAFKGGDGWFYFDNLDGFTLSGAGTFDGQGEKVWKGVDRNKDNKKDDIVSLRFNHVTNSVVEGITSLNSKMFHMNVIGCEKFTIQKVTITAPAMSPNTDGIHIGRSKGVNFTDIKIATGDDCVSVGDGTVDLGITKIKCGPGHGISIGSLGKYKNEEPVNGIYVKDCELTGTDNGVRIKSWPDKEPCTASNIHFEDITMKDVLNPVIIDQEYCPFQKGCPEQASSKVKLSDVTFKNIKGTSKTAEAVKLTCSKGNPCDKVQLANIDLKYSGSEGPAKSECKNVKVTVTGMLNPPGCK